MSIFRATKQHDTITTGYRALELFTDREEAIRLFSSFLNDDSPRERILYFYGEGGNGKSLLLKYLRQYQSKLQRTLTLSIERAGMATQVPTALLDFGMPPRGDERPQEAFSALLMLRRALAGNNLCFPLYDFACVWYLHKTGNLTTDRLKDLFPAEEMDLISGIVDAITQTSWAAVGKAVLNVFNTRLRERFTLYMRQRGIQGEVLTNIQRMEAESELIDELPRLFGEDLNAAMVAEESPERIVLFFDTHEAFWREQRNLPNDIFFQRDEWLRRLLGTLELSTGIVVAIGGQELPRWFEASRFKIPREHLYTYLVGNLSEPDATRYLKRAGVNNDAMCQCITEHAQVAPNQIHPLYLGLCADTVLAASESGTALSPNEFRSTGYVSDKANELVNRLLRYANVETSYAVRALSACRSFDRTIYIELGKKLNFAATEPVFKMLTQFSFVWQAEQHGEGRYRIHDLLRRLLNERNDETVRQADAVLEEYYRSRGEIGDASSKAEAIYHANRLDWERGVDEWTRAFETASSLGSYDLRRALLGVRNELHIKTDFKSGRVSGWVGGYFLRLARHDEARQELLQAIASYDKALEQTSGFIDAYTEKGFVLMRLGELHAVLSQYPEAIERYQQSIVVYDEALRRAPECVTAYNHKGLTLERLAESQAKLSQYPEAIESYRQAIINSDEGLKRDSTVLNVYSNRGVILAALGQLHHELSQYPEAVESYEQALVNYDEEIRRAPEYVHSYVNKAATLSSLGKARTALLQHKTAERVFNDAIAACDEALKLAPDYIEAYLNKGDVFLELGRSQADLEGSRPQAELPPPETTAKSYELAIAACDEVLKRAPDFVLAYNLKGSALLELGKLQAKLFQPTLAIGSYRKSLAVIDEAVARAPNEAATYHNKANALTGMGESYNTSLMFPEAIENYKLAIVACDEALKRAPNDVHTFYGKGRALYQLGMVRWKHILHFEPLITESLIQAITACDEALRRAPKFVEARWLKAQSLRNFGRVRAIKSQFELAIKDFQAALIEYSRVIEDASNNARLNAQLVTEKTEVQTLLDKMKTK